MPCPFFPQESCVRYFHFLQLTCNLGIHILHKYLDIILCYKHVPLIKETRFYDKHLLANYFLIKLLRGDMLRLIVFKFLNS